MRSLSPIIPSILTISKEDFSKKIEFAKTVGNSVQIDLIGQDFCPGRSLSLESWPSFEIEYAEAHLMVKRPIEYLEEIKKHGIIRAIIHVESTFDHEELVEKAKSLDILIGFAVNPDTDLDKIRPFLSISNYVQVMGVSPGFSGQQELPGTTLAVSYLKHLAGHRLVISVDGGVEQANIGELKKAGASYFVDASGIFEKGNWQENYRQLVNAAEDDN